MVRHALQTADVMAPGHAAVVGEPLFRGDIVSTGDNASAKILLSDQTIIDLGPNSMFKTDKLEEGGGGFRSGFFTLLYGRMRALVTHALGTDSKWMVRTPDALMGVRGTEFIVSSPLAYVRAVKGVAANMATKTELTVLSGEVGVAVARTTPGTGNFEKAPIVVPAGHMLTAIAGGAAPSPVKLEPAELRAAAAAGRVRDNTFERTITVATGAQNDQAPTRAAPRFYAIKHVSVVKDDATALAESPPPLGGIALLKPGAMLTDAPVKALPGNMGIVNVKLQ
jgi:hypothetical protein